MPDALLPDDVTQRLVAERQPQLLPVPGLEGQQQAQQQQQQVQQAGAPPAPADPADGVRQLRLSNGIRVNYRVTDNEPRSAMLRLVAMGGRAREGEPPSLAVGRCRGF